MKTLKIPTTLLVCLFLFSSSLKALEMKKVTFVGEIIIANADLDNVTVRLYEGNEIIQTYITDESGMFEMKLQLGGQYTFEIIKEGYITKRVQVNTKHENRIKGKIEDFAFYCELIPHRDWIDSSQLDFPITIIQLNERRGKFQYVSSYTKMMNKEQDKILEKLSLRFEF